MAKKLTFEEYKKLRFNPAQQKWISHKANWEQMTRWAVVMDYWDYIQSLDEKVLDDLAEIEDDEERAGLK